MLERFRDGYYKKEVEAVRHAPNAKEQDRLKRQCSCITVSCKGTKRSKDGVTQHSGFAAIDIDEKDNPGIDMVSKRKEIASDSYTFSVFHSIRGKGLCAICRIPSEDHEASYRALMLYFSEKFEVKVDSTPDVARARFVTYDPDLYLNIKSDVFDEVLPEPKKSASIRNYYPAATVPQSYGQIALQNAIRKIYEAAPGEKHNVRKRMSFWLGGLVATGFLNQYEAVEGLMEAVMQSSPQSAWSSAKKTIESGIREGSKKPILPDPVKDSVYCSKRDYEQKELVAQKIAVSNGGNAQEILRAVTDIYEEREQTILAFWEVIIKEEKGTYTLKLSRVKYNAFLQSSGFRKYRVGKSCIFVQVTNNVVRAVARDQIKDFVMAYLNELPYMFDNIFRSQLIDQVQREHKQFFDEGQLEFLEELPDNFVRDTKAKAYFFFRNGFAEVTKENAHLMDYSNLPGLIWEQQIIQHDFHTIDIDEVAEQCDFNRFLFHISNKDEKRYITLTSAIGYLLHGYKAPANPKIVILVDEAISEAPNGGTGKGLVFKAISKMLSVCTIDGKMVDFRDKFALQGVSEATRVLMFDDWDGKRLSFDKLFVMATGDMIINQLYHGQRVLPYELSPKIGITTNDMVGGEGASNARRKFEVEIAPYYSDTFRPSDEFGHEFFSDWSEEDWNLFHNLMLGCCRSFLAVGLRASAPVNINRRKLLQETSTEFAEFCDSLSRDWLYYRHEVWRDFIDTYSIKDTDLKFKDFGRWLNLYFKYQCTSVESGKTQTIGQYKDKYWFKITA
ncbi:BT4734/BF3469 family protein [Rufibacter immobilis]|uniref:BT4734/BF3469 family protein n=1 Tax=Rufibacter immobilis TaxID=1348778 RepID=UPI00366C1E1B